MEWCSICSANPSLYRWSLYPCYLRCMFRCNFPSPMSSELKTLKLAFRAFRRACGSGADWRLWLKALCWCTAARPRFCCGTLSSADSGQQLDKHGMKELARMTEAKLHRQVLGGGQREPGKGDQLRRSPWWHGVRLIREAEVLIKNNPYRVTTNSTLCSPSLSNRV